MTIKNMPPQELVRNAVIEVARLPEKDLLLVMEFVGELRKRRSEESPPPTTAEIRAEAERLAAQMKSLSREEVMARFRATTERIRAEAVARGTAIEGDWEGD